jgi:hypothetical protein
LQGVALKYEEEFHQALSSFARAQVSTGRFYTRIPVSEKAVLWIRINWIRIQIQQFIRIQFPIKSFDDQKLKKYRYS